jgi:hypothetical protein
VRKCRFCEKEIQDASTVCEHCGRDLFPGRAPVAVAPAEPVAPAYVPPAPPIAVRSRASAIAILFHVISMLCAVVGGSIGLIGVVFSKGAPQEAAAAAIGCLIVIAPYVFARGVDAVTR